MSAAGNAFIFLLQSEVHVDASLRHPRTFALGGRRIDLYPPFRNGEGIRFRRELHKPSLPYRPGTVHPDAVLPKMETSGRPGWKRPYVLADALRIDVFPSSDSEMDSISAIGRLVLDMLRLVTRQWWIGRGASESAEPLQNSFPVDVRGQPYGRTLSKTEYVLPYLGTEQLLNDHLLHLVSYCLEQGRTAPRSALTLLDAIHAMLHEDRAQAVLLTAIACEELFAEQCYEAAAASDVPRSDVRRVLKLPDLRHRLHHGAKGVLGRSFADEHPSDAQALGRLWVARHALAHGSRQQQQRNQVLNAREEFNKGMDGAFRFFEWCAQLRRRDLPDPMMFFTYPLTETT